MKPRILLALLLLGCAPPVVATSTICSFESDGDSPWYAFQFIGYGKIAMIQVDEPRGSKLGTYRVVDFDDRARRIHLVHDGADQQDVLPPFTLKGVGDKVVLSIDGKDLTGELDCPWSTPR